MELYSQTITALKLDLCTQLNLHKNFSNRIQPHKSLVSMHLYLKPIERTVILDQQVLQLVDGKVVAELTQEVGQVNSLH
jgi:hypothetical protein